MKYTPIPGYPGYYEPVPSTLVDHKFPLVAFKHLEKDGEHYMVEVIHPSIRKKK